MIDTETGYRLESVTYRQETDVHRFEYDVDRTATSMAVVAALSEVTERSPTGMEPLQTRVDADALDTLVGAETPVSVEFSMAGHEVGLDGEGHVDIAPSGDNRSVER
jgi:hypothetical protein